MSAGIQARVRAVDGWAVDGAVLTLTDMSGTQVAREQAGKDGVISGDTVPQGVYTAIFTAPGFDPLARTAMVTAGGSADLGPVELSRTGGSTLPAPGVWTIDPVHSAINVRVKHLGFASIRGRFGDFSGRIEVADPPTQSLVYANIDASSVDTSNKMRDDHLRSADFLAVDEFPSIEYTGRELTAVAADRWTLHGELTLKGVSKPVDLDLTYGGTGADPWGGQRAAFHASTQLRREDFNITFNQILAAGVEAIGATLQVELDIEAVQGDSLPSM